VTIEAAYARQCRSAATAPVESTSLAMVPPCTVPTGLASPGNITWLKMVRDSATVLASMLGNCPRLLTRLAMFAPHNCRIVYILQKGCAHALRNAIWQVWT